MMDFDGLDKAKKRLWQLNTDSWVIGLSNQVDGENKKDPEQELAGGSRRFESRLGWGQYWTHFICLLFTLSVTSNSLQPEGL